MLFGYGTGCPGHAGKMLLLLLVQASIRMLTCSTWRSWPSSLRAVSLLTGYLVFMQALSGTSHFSHAAITPWTNCPAIIVPYRICMVSETPRENSPSMTALKSTGSITKPASV